MWSSSATYLFTFPDGDSGDVEDMELGDVRTKLAQLVEPGSESRYDYDYDFGDGWEHDVRVRVLGRPIDEAVFDPDRADAALQRAARR